MDIEEERRDRQRHPDYWALLDAIGPQFSNEQHAEAAEFASVNEHALTIEGIGVLIEGGQLELPRGIIEFYLVVARGYDIDEEILESIEQKMANDRNL